MRPDLLSFALFQIYFRIMKLILSAVSLINFLKSLLTVSCVNMSKIVFWSENVK